MEGRREGWEGRKGLGITNNGRKGSRKKKEIMKRRKGISMAARGQGRKGRDGRVQGQKGRYGRGQGKKEGDRAGRCQGGERGVREKGEGRNGPGPK